MHNQAKGNKLASASFLLSITALSGYEVGIDCSLGGTCGQKRVDANPGNGIVKLGSVTMKGKFSASSVVLRRI